MSVTVTRPDLTDEERAERMAKVDACICEFWRKLKEVEAQRQQASRSEHIAEASRERHFVKHCQMCGVEYIANSAASKYCEAHREAGRELVQKKHREKRKAIQHQKLREKYAEGVTYRCRICGFTIRVHERIGNRQVCDACMMRMGGEYVSRMMCRKYVDEEVEQNV